MRTFHSFHPRCLALVAAFIAALLPGLAQADAQAYIRAADHMRQADWPGAQNAARGIGRDVVDWHRLRAGEGGFADYADFIARRPDWPGMDYLHQRGEGAISATTPPHDVIAYFAGRTPVTATGLLHLLAAFEQTGARPEAESLAARAWGDMVLSADAEISMLARFPAALAPVHEARLDMLLWAQEFGAAERLLANVGADWQALAAARIGLARDAAGVDALIAAVPDTLADHPGLAYERFMWRLRKDRTDDAIALLEQRSASAAQLGQPEKWASHRAGFTRAFMRAGQAEAAYSIAAYHHLTTGGTFADLEWLAGYIALSYLNDPELALGHFTTLREGVATPISLGRAGYWQGRAYEQMGDADNARAAFGFAAQHQTSFYGLLAAERAGIAMDSTLAGEPDYPDWRSANFAQSSVLEAALLLHEAGDQQLAARFLRHLAESLSPQELGQLGDLALSLDAPFLALRVAKYAADQGVVLPRAYYPMHDLARSELGVAPELALAIARRESEFYPAARSGVGALGLMQLMPGTAEAMAKALGIDFTPAALTVDTAYNARLGSAYLAQLIEEFGAAYPLVAAGYNAGPSRPRRWIEELGDPRSPGVDPIDWIEHLPFAETRNYIMRVMESLPIYRARLGGAPVPIRLSEELRGL